MTKWTDFVKEYAKEKGITYKNALSDPNCSSTYKQTKQTSDPKVANFIAQSFTNAITPTIKKSQPEITLDIVKIKNPYKKKKEP